MKEQLRTRTAGLGWTLHGDGRRVADGEVVAPDERLSWPRTVGIGMQHVVAMFGATLLVPTITGFPVTTTLLFSGVGTALFLLITRGRVPSYLGSSFAFIAPLTASAAEGPAAQLGGIVAVGLALVLVGLVVRALGSRVVDALMPPVVTGAIVALIGLNLAPVAVGSFEAQPLVAAITLTAILLVTVLGPGLVGRLGILVGVVVGWVFAAVTGGLAEERVTALRDAAWFGLPELRAPAFELSVVLLALPVVVVLVAENVGHVKAVAAM
ncbi:uracil-xanthine permease family protein, partial [Rhodococcus sp. P14]